MELPVTAFGATPNFQFSIGRELVACMSLPTEIHSANYDWFEINQRLYAWWCCICMLRWEWRRMKDIRSHVPRMNSRFWNLGIVRHSNVTWCGCICDRDSCWWVVDRRKVRDGVVCCLEGRGRRSNTSGVRTFLASIRWFPLPQKIFSFSINPYESTFHDNLWGIQGFESLKLTLAPESNFECGGYGAGGSAQVWWVRPCAGTFSMPASPSRSSTALQGKGKAQF